MFVPSILCVIQDSGAHDNFLFSGESRRRSKKLKVSKVLLQTADRGLTFAVNIPNMDLKFSLERGKPGFPLFEIKQIHEDS